MNRHVRPPALMSFDDFVAFVDGRPDEEKWELLEGHAVMSPSATSTHQHIVLNLAYFFETVRRAAPRAWYVLPGLSVHVAELPSSVPQPDVLIVPDAGSEGWYTDGPLAVFKVLSPSTRRRDLTVKRDIYRRMPTILDYVVIAPKKREVLLHSRATDWAPVAFTDADADVPLAALGLVLPLAEIYRDVFRKPA